MPSNNNNGESQLIGFSNTASSKFFSKLEIFSNIVCLSDYPVWLPDTLVPANLDTNMVQVVSRRIQHLPQYCLISIMASSVCFISKSKKWKFIQNLLFFPNHYMFWNYWATVLMQHSLSHICTAVKWAFVWQMFMSTLEIRQTLGAMAIRIVERQLIRCFSIILRLPYFNNYQSHLI